MPTGKFFFSEFPSFYFPILCPFVAGHDLSRVSDFFYEAPACAFIPWAVLVQTA
jgi:hypothetical protein